MPFPRQLIAAGVLGGSIPEINIACPAITPSLGAELWDADAAVFTSGTYHWAAYGGNTIDNDANTLKITYVNNGNGAYNTLADAADLSSNLTVNSWYKFSIDTKVNAGSTVAILLVDGIGGFTIRSENGSAGFTTTPAVFRSRHASNGDIHMSGMFTGEILWLDNLSLIPVTGVSTFVATHVRKTGTWTCKPTVADNSAAGFLVAYADSSNYLWCTVQRLGTDQAQIWKVVGGTWTSVIAGNITYGAAQDLSVVINGTDVSLLYNGVQVGSTTAVADMATMGLDIYGFNNLTGNTVGQITTSPSVFF